MKILFAVQFTGYIDQLGIMLLSALAKRSGHTTGICVLSQERILRRVEEWRPDVVAYSAATGEHKYYVEANKSIKTEFPDIYTIMGGPHVTFYPDTLDETTLDAICIGEGEEAFLSLLSALDSHQTDFHINNIRTREERNVELSKLVEDLDSLPFPDRDLFYSATEMGQWPLKSFITSRGCPYTCSYCFNQAFRKMYSGKGKFIRRHSVDYVIEEIRGVMSRYKVQFVKFYDDVFTYRADYWLEDFAKKYPRQIQLPFHCLTRADLMNEDVARLLKQAGCRSVSMSIETGNYEIRKKFLHRDMSNQTIINAFNICHKYGIDTFSNNILGLPYTTIDNEFESIDLNIRAGASYAEFPIFQPYPGTKLGDYCIKEGIYEADYSSFHISNMNKSPLKCFDRKQINRQRNLSALAMIAIWKPWTKRSVRLLSLLPYNWFFFFLYYLVKMYLNKTLYYPMKLNARELVQIFKKSIKYEYVKKFDEALCYKE